MSKSDFFWKRFFDIAASVVGIVIFSPIILLCWIVAAIETRSNGFFMHERIGRHGELITVCKIKTMYQSVPARSPITVSHTACITKSGRVFRTCKLDELPQLFNVLSGSMSFVGPRPDVAEYTGRLQGSDRLILLMRPGITGPASIKYKNEEEILSAAADPVAYNETIIWPDKIKINKEYFLNYSFVTDMKYILHTFLK